MNELDLYDYELPEELIASRPAKRREDARLMIVRRDSGSIDVAGIRDLPDLLQPADCLVLNDTRVLPARLLGVRTATGGAWEGLFLGSDSPGNWTLLCKTRGKLQSGERITMHRAHDPDSAERFVLTLVEPVGDGIWLAQPETRGNAVEVLQKFGTVPLPPYIKRELATDEDRERYQTTFARRDGAVAAPTAGLHFTPGLLQQCADARIDHTFVTLHVGIGTFRPIATSNLDEHRMHAEWCEVSEQTAAQLTAARKAGGRIISVGTTTVRTLESAAQSGRLEPFSGQTEIFIRPPYNFHAVDCLLTNFHLPRSSLLVMISAFAGRELILSAYAEAVRQRFRFFSYGDAMLIV